MLLQKWLQWDGPPPVKAPPPCSPVKLKASHSRSVYQARSATSGELLLDPRRPQDGRPWQIAVDVTHTIRTVRVVLERDFDRRVKIVYPEAEGELAERHFVTACKPKRSGELSEMIVYFPIDDYEQPET
jgi:hypothetical protein